VGVGWVCALRFLLDCFSFGGLVWVSRGRRLCLDVGSCWVCYFVLGVRVGRCEGGVGGCFVCWCVLSLCERDMRVSGFGYLLFCGGVGV